MTVRDWLDTIGIISRARRDAHKDGQYFAVAFLENVLFHLEQRLRWEEGGFQCE